MGLLGDFQNYFDDIPGETTGDTEEDFEVGCLSGSCQCGWSNDGTYFVGDEKDLQSEVDALLTDHEEKYPSCQFTPCIEPK